LLFEAVIRRSRHICYRNRCVEAVKTLDHWSAYKGASSICAMASLPSGL
jgi:hypothetical protein